MAFKKYEPRLGGSRSNHLVENRFPLCWLGKSTKGVPASLAFNKKALELFGESTTHVEVMWDSEGRRFAFIPSFGGAGGALKLSRSHGDIDGTLRIATQGLVKHFPDIAPLGGRVWRIIPDDEESVFIARFASQKELTEAP